jgi:hypothetical protein
MNRNHYRNSSKYYLDKLNKIMGADFSAKTPFFLYIFPDFVAKLWVISSILATPYIIWILIKLKRVGWVVSFFFFVVLPYVLGFSFIEVELIRTSMIYLPLLNLSVYYFLLKLTYTNWYESNFIITPESVNTK